MFTFALENGIVNVCYNGRPLLKNITLQIRLRRGEPFCCAPRECTHQNGQAILLFKTDDRLEKLALHLIGNTESAQLSIDAKAGETFSYEDFTFAAEAAVTIGFSYALPVKGMLSSSLRDDPFWQEPTYEKSFLKLPPKTQSILAHSSLHYHFLALEQDAFRCSFSGSTVSLSPGYSHLTALHGAFLGMAASQNPYRAVENNFSFCRQTGGLHVPLRSDRVYPEIFEYLGFCTWDAFYTDVNAAGIFKKLEEFKQKQIPIRWVIIDDGWMQTENGKLCSFSEDKTKFPEGLASAIRRMKEDYNILYVGVWHAFAGYWYGVTPNSELHRAQQENLFVTPTGWVLPKPERTYRFYSAWHSYLREQGVDFVKVDAQSGLSPKLDETLPCVQGVRLYHEGLEKSVAQYFNGAMINCMGMDMENIQNRPISALNRNSKDFQPRLPQSFFTHATANLSFAPVHSQIHYCDFDMFWSQNGANSAILRAISGGPVYVSDSVGNSDAALLHALCESDGRIRRLPQNAYPALSCLYCDCQREGKPLLAINRYNENYMAAAFGPDAPTEGRLALSDLPGAPPEAVFLAQEYFTKKFYLIKINRPLAFALESGQCALWNLYRVSNGSALVGDPDKMAGIMNLVKTIPLKSCSIERQ